jgi:NTE family protein
MCIERILEELMNADAVFEGSGVKGIGIVGAVCYMEEKGYTWQRLAGSSSGAIIAALLAVGYKGKDIKKMLLNFEYLSLMDKTKIQSIPLIGKGLGIFFEKAMYSGDEIETWIGNILKAAGKTKFKDVSINGESKLKLIASDITLRRMIILPDDLIKYDIDPMEFEIAKAVRMSVGIPLYFKPYKLDYSKGISYIVDGGILSNFPVWIFDTKGIPRWPTIGFKIVEPAGKTASGKTDVFSFLEDTIDTVIEHNETIYIKDKDFVRTITIPSSGVSTTDFGITNETSLKLYNAGFKSAEKFYKTWDFENYIKQFRSGRQPARRERLLRP